MRTFAQLKLILMVAACSGCVSSTSVPPPSGWVKIATSKFEMFVLAEISAGGSLDTNRLFGQFKGQSIFLSFGYEVSHEDYSGFTKATHFASHEERIVGKRAKIVEFYYEPFAGFHEFIAVDFPHLDAAGRQLTVAAICMSTNDYQTARTIFRTIRFKQE